jgi:quinol monooxygenase YgiN
MVDEPHVVRITRVRIKPGCEPEFEMAFDALVGDVGLGFPGMLRLYRMRSTPSDGVTEYVMQSVWRSRSALERYKTTTGGPVIPREVAGFIDSGSVDEYELLAVDDYDVF